jgi:hypothetical protein
MFLAVRYNDRYVLFRDRHKFIGAGHFDRQAPKNYGLHRIFSNYCNKNVILLVLLWIADKLETCLRISLVFFFEENWD